MFRVSTKLSMPIAACIGVSSLNRQSTIAYSQQSTTNIITTKKTSSSSSSLNLTNKIVLITGATAGIGKSCAWRFAEEGCKLILMGRREDRLELLKNELLVSYPLLKINTISLSVTDIEKIELLPTTLPDEFKDVDIIVNNAGLALGVSYIDNNNVNDARTVLDTNVLGVIALCSAFVPGMKKRGDGHIINMGSVAGHYSYASGSVYNASKYALRGFTEAARHDLAGTPLRVTLISPGLVGNTEFSNVRLKDDLKAAAVYENVVPLHPDDVADTVIYAATRPAHVQIADIIMYCTNQSGPRDLQRVGHSLGKD